MKIQIKERPYLIPSYYQILRDEALTLNPTQLETHFNDVYKLYLRRLSDFEMQADVDYKFENELAAILSELFRLKRALNEEV